MKYNYYNAVTGDEISSDDTLEWILHDFHDLYMEGSFLTLTGENGEILQFILEDGNWVVDIPNIEKMVSFQKSADIDEVCGLIEQFYNGKLIDTYDFEIVSI